MRIATVCFYISPVSLQPALICVCFGCSCRSLSYNNLSRLDDDSLAVLGDLHTLRLGHNSISHIMEGAFRGLKALRIL